VSLEDARVYWHTSQFSYLSDRQNRTGAATAKSNGLYLLSTTIEWALLLGFGAVDGKKNVQMNGAKINPSPFFVRHRPRWVHGDAVTQRNQSKIERSMESGPHGTCPLCSYYFRP
jgi:hypothetical protein